MNAKQKEDAVTLEILQNIEENEQVTQRHLADSLGVALGLTNSYLKRCANKGLIKIKHVPANRYLYYLTPKGFAEKSRLTAEYLSYSFGFYREASESVNEIFSLCSQHGHTKILFCGISELAEIASVRLHENNLEHIATLEWKIQTNSYLGKPVWFYLDNTEEKIDAYLITTLNKAEETYKKVNEKISKEKIFVPNILGISI